MLESLVGASVAATLQKAGRFWIGAPDGGAKVPAGTRAAVVMVVWGNFNCARLSHVAAAAGHSKASTETANSQGMGRYVPFMYLLLLVETLLRMLVGRMKPVAFSHTPPGAYANYATLPVAALMLILSFTPRRGT
jgi:hypothetical protein